MRVQVTEVEGNVPDDALDCAFPLLSVIFGVRHRARDHLQAHLAEVVVRVGLCILLRISLIKVQATEATIAVQVIKRHCFKFVVL